MSAKRSTPCDNSRAVHILPDNSRTAVDSEVSSINAKKELNKKSTMVFPTSHQLSHASLLMSPKWGSDTQICRFFAEISTKNHQESGTKFHCLKTSSCEIIVQSYLSNSINILARDDPAPVKFGPKRYQPPIGRMHVSHTACCAVSDSRPSCLE